ncbi:MAG: hypothetical protein M3N08_02565 [Pseudomonadota bacterium]|nr:hypothetical protein [Pseudomonadota bacterium]
MRGSFKSQGLKGCSENSFNGITQFGFILFVFRRLTINPTLLGSFAVLVWALALPVARSIETEIGVLAYIGSLFGATAGLGFLAHRLRGEPLVPRGVLRNQLFYARWFLFLGNIPCVMTAVYIVHKPYVPFVILLNYLWPTTTILFSVLLGGVLVKRVLAFVAGMLIVVAALAAEVLQPSTVTANLFSSPVDCLAYFLAVMAAVCWGGYSALTRRAAHATGGSAVIPVVQSSLAAALPLSFVPAVGGMEPSDGRARFRYGGLEPGPVRGISSLGFRHATRKHGCPQSLRGLHTVAFAGDLATAAGRGYRIKNSRLGRAACGRRRHGALRHRFKSRVQRFSRQDARATRGSCGLNAPPG